MIREIMFVALLALVIGQLFGNSSRSAEDPADGLTAGTDDGGTGSETGGPSGTVRPTGEGPLPVGDPPTG